MNLNLDTRLSLTFLTGMFLVLGHALTVTLFSAPVSEPILATGSGLMLATSAALWIRNGNGNGNGNKNSKSGRPPNGRQP